MTQTDDGKLVSLEACTAYNKFLEHAEANAGKCECFDWHENNDDEALPCSEGRQFLDEWFRLAGVSRPANWPVP